MEFLNNIFSSISNYFSSWGKEPTPPVEEAKPTTPTAEDTPASSLLVGESIAKGAAAAAAGGAAGAAAASVALNANQSNKDQWIANGAGPKATLPTEVENKDGTRETTTNKLRQLSQYIKENCSEAQQNNAKAFLEDVKSDPTLISKITEGLTKTGITDAQVEQLGDGKFNIEDYKELVKSGQPIG